MAIETKKHNFNTSWKPDNTLFKNNIHELISLYGVQSNFIFTNKMNKDFVLRDFSHFSSYQEAFEVFVLPEDTTNWTTDLQWDVFGLDNLRTISFFMSADTYNAISERFFENNDGTIINSLLVMPNGAVLEITDIDYDVEGGNNLFLFSDEKSVYRLVCKKYIASKQDEIIIKDDIETEEEVEIYKESGVTEVEYNEDEIADKVYKNLEDYFERLDGAKEEQDDEGKKISSSDSIFGNLS